MIPLDEFPLPSGAPPTRLDRLLAARYPWLSRPALADLISTRTLLNGRPAAKGSKPPPCTLLQCRNIPEPADLLPPPDPTLPLRILYEDDALLALDKPAGIPVHPLRPGETGTLVNALLARRPALATIGPDPRLPAILHRLDTLTSGLLLAAKTQTAYHHLRAQFRSFSVEKHYLAVVSPPLSTPGTLALPLTHQTRTPCKMRPLRPGETLSPRETFAATTRWTPLKSAPPLTLLDVTIFTGVTHQIRCHLAHSGHPVLGDRIYAPLTTPLPPRHWLHAHTLRLLHPLTNTPLTLTAPPPPDFPIQPDDRDKMEPV